MKNRVSVSKKRIADQESSAQSAEQRYSVMRPCPLRLPRQPWVVGLVALAVAPGAIAGTTSDEVRGYAGATARGDTGSGGEQGYTGATARGYTGSGVEQGYTGSGVEQGYTGSGVEQGYTGSGVEQGYTGSGVERGYTGS